MTELAQAFSVVGKPFPQLDARIKATGAALFASELRFPGMLHGKILRSPLPHARILDIDVSQARRLPGVRAVITAQDTPGKKFGAIKADQVVFAQDRVIFLGQEVAAVAAIDEDVAEEALSLIKVDFEELPAVFDPEEALLPGAPEVHPGGNVAHQLLYHHGNIEQGLQESDYVFEARFRTQIKHQAHLEARCCVARADPSGRITVWGGFQTVYRVRGALAAALGIPASKIRVIQPFMGGGFGGKTSSAKAPIAVLLAMKSERPVRIANSWAEEFQAARPRAPGIIDQKIGVKKDGTLVFRQVRAIVDCGAFTGNIPAGTMSMCVRADNLYRFSHLKGEGLSVYTNKTPTGACRGFGNPEGHFALESQVDEIAHQLGLDPLDLRIKNAVPAGYTTLHGWQISSCGLKECLEQVALASGWHTRKKEKGRGLGLACAIHHSGLRTFMDFAGSSALVKVDTDGRVILITGEGDMGQGAWTGLAQIVAEELGARFEDLQVATVDTEIAPYCLGAFAARVTVAGGHAVRLAAADAREQLFKIAAQLLEANPEDLRSQDGQIFVQGAPSRSISFAQASQAALFRQGGAPVLGRGFYDPPTVMPDKATLYGNPSLCYSFTAQAAEVEVDEGTGQVKLNAYYAADDIGRVINPLLAEGQVEGCISYGVGLALTEEMLFEGGRVINPSFMDYRVASAPDLPSIKPMLVGEPDPLGPFGAKSASEISVDAVPAAIGNAVFAATGARIRQLPLTPERVFSELKSRK